MSLSRGGWLPAAKPRSAPQALLPSWVLVFLGGGKVHGRGGNVSQQPPVRTELLPR